jgi:hypothetical protein
MTLDEHGTRHLPQPDFVSTIRRRGDTTESRPAEALLRCKATSDRGLGAAVTAASLRDPSATVAPVLPSNSLRRRGIGFDCKALSTNLATVRCLLRSDKHPVAKTRCFKALTPHLGGIIDCKAVHNRY